MRFPLVVAKDNPVIKKVVALANAAKLRQHKLQAVIYGEHCLIEALKHQAIEQIFILETAVAQYLPLIPKAEQHKIILLSAPCMAKINLLDSPLKLAALIKISYNPVQAPLSPADSLWLERIQDPGNLGTILRVASAAAIKRVYISSDSVDIYNPKVLRAAQGLQFSLDLRVNCDLVNLASNYSGQIIAFSPHVSQSLYSCDLRKPSALVFGNEGMGISKELLEVIKLKATIPMPGMAESLNLAMAVTVAVFELSRQRMV
jgi:TrmH family RNA methyltransferase